MIFALRFCDIISTESSCLQETQTQEAVRGYYIFYQDSDDEITAGLYRKMVKVFLVRPKENGDSYYQKVERCKTSIDYA